MEKKIEPELTHCFDSFDKRSKRSRSWLNQKREEQGLKKPSS